jgi:hypothetical protein
MQDLCIMKKIKQVSPIIRDDSLEMPLCYISIVTAGFYIAASRDSLCVGYANRFDAEYKTHIPLWLEYKAE